MKKNILKSTLLTLCLAVMILACKDDEGPTPITSDFGSIASTYFEKNGTGTITIPFRNATPAFVSNPDIKFSGSATLGSDFTLVGVTAEGIQLSIIDDNLIELDEIIKVRIGSTGNSIHEVTILSNCEDTESPYLGYFSGTYAATEKYGPTPDDWYGPYNLTLVQDATDPTKFSMTNFYDAGRGAYVKVDLEAGTIFFPNQTPSGSTRVLTNSSGTYTITPCGIEVEIALNYDGGDWVYGWTLEKN